MNLKPAAKIPSAAYIPVRNIPDYLAFEESFAWHPVKPGVKELK